SQLIEKLRMVSLYYGYLYTYFVESEGKDISPWLIGVLFVTTFFSLFGAFKSIHTQYRSINHLHFRLRFDGNHSKIRSDLQQQKSSILTILFATFLHLTNGYGFDGSNSCNPKASRRGRAQFLETIPCDLTVQTYCNQPGSLYPWHAVRRFVHENQGLMRRMYGDVKHISVLRTEVNNNDIELDDVEQATARYSRSGWKKNKYLYSDPQKAKVNSIVSEPHFRPASTSPKPTTTTTSSTTELTFISDNKVENNNVTFESQNVDDQKEILAEKDANGDEVRETLDVKFSNNSEAATISTTLRIFLPPKFSQSSITPPSSEDELESTTQYVEDDVTNLSDNIRQKDITTDNREETISDATPKQANVRPSDSIEGQLFQDVAPKEEPVYNSRGVNACPVKEEVVAPFWANNTRGEVLALLNLYPFEQYVHWEKCTNENKQMYCRDGCRCEQQYRLHRLLAYDPHNECRGIFSDWFRFPSCCICKCYDIPLEYRVTSRSPRNLEKLPIDVAQEEVKKAVYGHATENWYRPSDDLDLEYF
ncbi:Protein spaetzle 4, partial [Pseudolycoriella hygida]